MDSIKNDKNLCEAVNRREQQLAPMPADLNERLMQRLGETEQARPEAKQRHLWLYTAIAVAASIVLLIVFNFGKDQTSQEPLVAQTVEQPTASVPELVEGKPVEGEPVIEEPTNTVSELVEAPVPQPSQKPAKKQRKVVMKLVELIPTSEATTANVKTLPASVIDKVKAYDKASDPSRMTGIDDQAPLVERTMGIDDPDPLVAMATQVESIRQRGQRLEREIDKRIDN
jgi:hypothetical protein